MEKIPYGDHAFQYGQLFRPVASRFSGVAVVIHGGYWHTAHGAELGVPLAEDLAAHGVTAWNIEYRRAEDDGGWPETLEDVAAAIDHLATLDVDTSAVVLIGHSAGGHLATWASSRPNLPDDAPGALPRVEATAVVSQAGVLDIALAHELNLGNGAVENFLGPDDDSRYELADPARLVPAPVPVWVLYSDEDETVPTEIAFSYAAMARAAGGVANLVETSGGHMSFVDVASPQWQTCRAVALGELA